MQRDGDVALGFSNQLADAVARVAPSVVRVVGRPGPAASGTVWNVNTVVTADHAVDPEHEAELRIGRPDGSESPASLLGRDPSLDLAVLRVDAGGLTPPPVAGELPRVGSLSVAVGRPGAGPSASLGLVSELDAPARTHRGGVLLHAIRVDAVMYPGFSGGALVDVAGAVLGLNVSVFPAPGPGLAIPWPDLGPLVDAITRQGRVVRGYLGVGVQAIELDAPAQAAAGGQARALLVTSVAANSPAAAAGLLQGDLLISVDGTAVPPPAGVGGDVFFHHAVPFQIPLPPSGPGSHRVIVRMGRGEGAELPRPPIPPGPVPIMHDLPPSGMPPLGPPGPLPPFGRDRDVHYFWRRTGESDDLQAFLGPDRVGSRLTVRFLRGGRIQELDVTVGERP